MWNESVSIAVEEEATGKKEVAVDLSAFNIETQRKSKTVWELEHCKLKDFDSKKPFLPNEAVKVWVHPLSKWMHARENSAFIFWEPPAKERKYTLYTWLGNSLCKGQIEVTARYVSAIAYAMRSDSDDPDGLKDKYAKAEAESQAWQETIPKKFKISLLANDYLESAKAQAKAKKETIQAELDLERAISRNSPLAVGKLSLKGYLQKAAVMQGLSICAPQWVPPDFNARIDGIPAVNLITSAFGKFDLIYHVFSSHDEATGNTTVQYANVRVQDLQNIRMRLHGVFLCRIDGGVEWIRYITTSATPQEIAFDIPSAHGQDRWTTIRQGNQVAIASTADDLCSPVRLEAQFWNSIKHTAYETDSQKDAPRRRRKWQYENGYKYGIAILDAKSLNILRYVLIQGAPSLHGLWLTAPIAKVGFCGDGSAVDQLMIVSTAGNGFAVPARASPGRFWLAASPVPVQSMLVLENTDVLGQKLCLATVEEKGETIEPASVLIQSGSYGWIKKPTIEAKESAGDDGNPGGDDGGGGGGGGTYTAILGHAGVARISPDDNAPIAFYFAAKDRVLAQDVAIVGHNTSGTTFTDISQVQGMQIHRKDSVNDVKAKIISQEEAISSMQRHANDTSDWVCITKRKQRVPDVAVELLPAGCWGGEQTAKEVAHGESLHYKYDGWGDPADISRVHNGRVPIKTNLKVNSTLVSTRIVVTASSSHDGSVQLCDPAIKSDLPGVVIKGCSNQVIAPIQSKMNFKMWDATGEESSELSKVILQDGGQLEDFIKIEDPSTKLTGNSTVDDDTEPEKVLGEKESTRIGAMLYGKEDGQLVENPMFDLNMDGAEGAPTGFQEYFDPVAAEANSLHQGVSGKITDFGLMRRGTKKGVYLPTAQNESPEDAAITLTVDVSEKGDSVHVPAPALELPPVLGIVGDEDANGAEPGGSFTFKRLGHLFAKELGLSKKDCNALHDGDRYWFTYEAPDGASYMYLWSGAGYKERASDQQIEEDFFAAAYEIGAVAQILVWSETEQTRLSIYGKKRREQSKSRTKQIYEPLYTKKAASTIDHLGEAEVVELLKESGLDQKALRSVWIAAKADPAVQHGANGKMNFDEFVLACRLAVKAGGTFANTAITKPITTNDFLSIFPDAKTPAIINGSATDAADRDHRYFGIRDGSMPDKDKAKAIIARLPNSPSPIADEDRHSQDQADNNVEIVFDVSDNSSTGLSFEANREIGYFTAKEKFDDVILGMKALDEFEVDGDIWRRQGKELELHIVASGDSFKMATLSRAKKEGEEEGGIGVDLGNAQPGEGMPVLSVAPGGQAEGLLEPGECITAINGKSVLGLTTDQADKFLLESDSIVLTLDTISVSVRFCDKNGHWTHKQDFFAACGSGEEKKKKFQIMFDVSADTDAGTFAATKVEVSFTQAHNPKLAAATFGFCKLTANWAGHGVNQVIVSEPHLIVKERPPSEEKQEEHKERIKNQVFVLPSDPSDPKWEKFKEDLNPFPDLTKILDSASEKQSVYAKVLEYIHKKAEILTKEDLDDLKKMGLGKDVAHEVIKSFTEKTKKSRRPESFKPARWKAVDEPKITFNLNTPAATVHAWWIAITASSGKEKRNKDLIKKRRGTIMIKQIGKRVQEHIPEVGKKKIKVGYVLTRISTTGQGSLKDADWNVVDVTHFEVEKAAKKLEQFTRDLKVKKIKLKFDVMIDISAAIREMLHEMNVSSEEGKEKEAISHAILGGLLAEDDANPQRWYPEAFQKAFKDVYSATYTFSPTDVLQLSIEESAPRMQLQEGKGWTEFRSLLSQNNSSNIWKNTSDTELSDLKGKAVVLRDADRIYMRLPSLSGGAAKAPQVAQSILEITEKYSKMYLHDSPKSTLTTFSFITVFEDHEPSEFRDAFKEKREETASTEFVVDNANTDALLPSWVKAINADGDDDKPPLWFDTLKIDEHSLDEKVERSLIKYYVYEGHDAATRRCLSIPEQPGPPFVSMLLPDLVGKSLVNVGGVLPGDTLVCIVEHDIADIADPDVPVEPVVDGDAPVVACRAPQHIYTMLFERAPLRYVRNHEEHPLFVAAKHGHDRVVEYILDPKSNDDWGRVDANDQKFKNENGQTPLITAIVHGHFKVAAVLLQHDARVNVVDCAGLTAIDKAHPIVMSIDKTLPKKPNASYRPSREFGWVAVAKDSGDGAKLNYLPPLHFAVQNGHARLVKLLLTAGANPRVKCHPKRDFKQLATSKKELKAKEMPTCKDETVDEVWKLLEKKKSSKNSVDSTNFIGEMPDWEMTLMQTLVGDRGMTLVGTHVFGINPGLFFASDPNGNTLLHHAVLDQNVDMVRDLLSADPETIFLIPKLWLTMNKDAEDALAVCARKLAEAYKLPFPKPGHNKKKSKTGACTCKKCAKIKAAREVSDAMVDGITRYMSAGRFALPPTDNPRFMESILIFVDHYPELAFPFVEILWSASMTIPGLAALPSARVINSKLEDYHERLKRSFLHKYVSLSDEDQDRVFDMKHAQQLVDFKWKMFGQKSFNFEGLLYLVLLAAFAVQSFFIVSCPPVSRGFMPFNTTTTTMTTTTIELENATSQEIIEKKCAALSGGVFSDDALRIAPLVCVFIVAVLSLRLLKREFQQVLFNGPTLYFRDPWNWLDWVQLTIVGTTEIMFLIGEKEQHDNMRTVAAIATFILWSQSLFYLRAFQSTGKFVSMVIAMVIDIRFFVLILGIFVLAHANAFFLLFAGCNSSADCTGGWDTVANVIYSSINMLIYGDFDLDSLDGTKEVRVTRTLFVISEFMVAVVLLNLLIAIMGATYDAISEKEDVEFYKLRASSLVELEAFLSKDALSKGVFFPRVLPRRKTEGSNPNAQLLAQDCRPTAVATATGGFETSKVVGDSKLQWTPSLKDRIHESTVMTQQRDSDNARYSFRTSSSIYVNHSTRQVLNAADPPLQEFAITELSNGFGLRCHTGEYLSFKNNEASIEWENDNVEGESTDEKEIRKGEKPRPMPCKAASLRTQQILEIKAGDEVNVVHIMTNTGKYLSVQIEDGKSPEVSWVLTLDDKGTPFVFEAQSNSRWALKTKDDGMYIGGWRTDGKLSIFENKDAVDCDPLWTIWRHITPELENASFSYDTKIDQVYANRPVRCIFDTNQDGHRFKIRTDSSDIYRKRVKILQDEAANTRGPHRKLNIAGKASARGIADAKILCTQVWDLTTERVSAVPDPNMRITDRKFNIAGKAKIRGATDADLGSLYGVGSVEIEHQKKITILLKGKNTRLG